jgi:hypothetical protein
LEALKIIKFWGGQRKQISLDSDDAEQQKEVCREVL